MFILCSSDECASKGGTVDGFCSRESGTVCCVFIIDKTDGPFLGPTGGPSSGSFLGSTPGPSPGPSSGPSSGPLNVSTRYLDLDHLKLVRTSKVQILNESKALAACIQFCFQLNVRLTAFILCQLHLFIENLSK